MGIFGRKRDDFDDDLSITPLQAGLENKSADWRAQQSQPPAAQSRPSQTAQTTKQKPVENFGFEQVSQLISNLPLNENKDLVIKVFKKTLESVNISLGLVIEDANRQIEDMGEKIADAKQTISALQQEIVARKKESADLENHMNEITKIRDLLVSAEQMGKAETDADVQSQNAGDAKAQETTSPGKVIFARVSDLGTPKK